MAKVEWYGTRSDTYRKIVRGVPGVKAADIAKAEEIHAKAEMFLAPHHANNAPNREPGDSVSRLSVESGVVDAYVVLTDEDGGAAAIEYYLAPMKKGAGLVAGES